MSKKISSYSYAISFLFFILLSACGGSNGGENESLDNATSSKNITGSVQFEEYIPTDEGLSDTVYSKPVRYARFDILSESNQSHASGFLDGNGQFQVTLNGLSSGYLKVYSDTRGSDVADVYTVNSSNNLYTFKSDTTDFNNNETIDLLIPVSNHGEISGAFNILDVAATCTKCVIDATGTFHPDLRLTWELGNVGTVVFDKILTTSFFCRTDSIPTIYLSGGIKSEDGSLDLKSETAHFDDMVIAHETGHFIQNTYSYDASQGGGHNGNNLYPSLALSEGFATFFAAVCLDNPNYIATIGLPPEQQLNFSNYNIEDIDNISYRSYGIQSEFTVSEVLWDIYDGSTDYPTDFDADGVAVDFAAIIEIFETFEKNSNYPFLVSVLNALRDRGILTEMQISGLLAYPTDQNIDYPFSVAWPFPMEFGYAYPLNGEPYFIGIPEAGTIESEAYLFSGSFFLNQFWTFTLDSSADVTITFGVDDESPTQSLKLELYRNDNTLLKTKSCQSGSYFQLSESLQAGKYIIKITAYNGNTEQHGNYWIAVEK